MAPTERQQRGARLRIFGALFPKHSAGSVQAGGSRSGRQGSERDGKGEVLGGDLAELPSR